MAVIKREIKAALAEAAKEFYENGWTPGEDSGDISVRDPETGLVYLYPRPCAKIPVIRNWSVLTEEFIPVADPDGNLVGDTHLYPTVEWPMHIAIYRARKDINAIVHSHAVYSSAFAVTGQNIPCVLAELTLFLGGEIPCAPFGKVGSWDLADKMVAALGKDKMAALMRSHGAIACGADLDQAMSYHAFLEKSAQTVLYAKLLGKLEILDPNDVLDESLSHLPWD
jgi:L-fuculose-phosphate aldolase